MVKRDGKVEAEQKIAVNKYHHNYISFETRSHVPELLLMAFRGVLR